MCLQDVEECTYKRNNINRVINVYNFMFVKWTGTSRPMCKILVSQHNACRVLTNQKFYTMVQLTLFTDKP